jgi:hypothetical protein
MFWRNQNVYPFFYFMNTTLNNGKHSYLQRTLTQSQSGIYKVLFGDYFTLAVPLILERISTFRCVCGSNNPMGYNKKMAYVLKFCCIIKFEIIMVVEDTSLLKKIETDVIQMFKYSPFLINRSVDGNSNKGIKWTEEERNKITETTRNKRKNKPHKIKVAKKSGIPKGYKFSEDSNKSRREKLLLNPPKLSSMAKTVIQFDLNKNKMQEFKAISLAAKSIGSTPKQFKKQLTKSKRKYYKGYIWKIA